MIIDQSDYLAHHGVKGMKWGVRRARDPVTGKKVPRTREEKIALAEKSVKIASTAIVGGLFAAKIISGVNHNRKVRLSRNPATNPQLRKVIDNQNEVRRSREAEKWLRQNFMPNNGPTPVSHIKPNGSPTRLLKTPVKSEARFMHDFTKKHNAAALVENERLRKWYDDFQIPLPQREFMEIWPE